MSDYISSTGRYIYISPNKKIINPSHDAPLYNYVGPIDDFNFKHQKTNFENIQRKLEENGDKLTFIFAGKFMGTHRPKTVFLAHNNDRTFWWRKYESKAEGSGQNIVYRVNNNEVEEIKLSLFLNPDFT